MSNFFTDLLFGARPDMRYTGAQDALIGWGSNYGEQMNPLYHNDVHMSRLYERGGVGKGGKDKSGKLLAFAMPARRAMEAEREGTVDEYSRAAGSGFSAGGPALAAAGGARIRNEANQRIGDTIGGMYVQRGEQLHDRVTSAYESAKNREIAAHGIAAGVAGRGPYDATRKGGLLDFGEDLLKKYAFNKIPPPGGGGAAGGAAGGGGAVGAGGEPNYGGYY